VEAGDAEERRRKTIADFRLLIADLRNKSGAIGNQQSKIGNV
jgi:hypothetical protein